jgi:DNA primase
MASKSTTSDRSQIEEIKQRLNIEEIVKEYVNLKPRGKNLFGICPFHSEDTPSFSVNGEIGIYKCFGCGESGDVIDFMMKIENLEFREALEKLAKRAGIELKSSPYSKKQSKKYLRAKRAHKLAAKYFNYILRKHKLGKKGRNYIRQRQLTKSAIEEFQVGYAPGFNSSNSLTATLKKEKFKPQELVEFGLAKSKNGRVYDKFFDRLMFPIIDTSGNVIGFSGRVLDSDEKRPKYLNTPETILFKKRNNLFGLYQAKGQAREKDFMILVEGQTDVISSWQVGIKNIVAPLGTGLTDSQLKKIERFTRNIVLSFDNDKAGFRARLRTSELAYKLGLNVEAIEIPKGKDADECIKIDPKLWEDAVRSKVPTITFFLEKMAKKYDLTSLESKQKIIKYIIPLLKAAKDQMIQDHHIKEISGKANISENVLRKSLKSPKEKDLLRKELKKETQSQKNDLSQEIYLLSLLLQNKRYLEKYKKKLKRFKFQNKQIQNIFDELLSEKFENIEEMTKNLPADQQMLVEDALMRPLWIDEPTEGDVENDIKNTIMTIYKKSLQREIKDLKKEIRRLEQLKKNEKANKLLSRMNDLIAKLQEIDED